MLDPEVTAFLRKNPEVFSKLLHRLLGDSNSSVAAATFTGKQKINIPKRRNKIPKSRAPATTRNEPDDPPALEQPPLRLPETEQNAWDDLVVDDVKHKIFSALFDESLRDERVFLDLLLLALVSKDLHKSLKPLIKKLEARIDAVPLYCRALFEYMHDPPTFRLFLSRIEEPAPAVHAAWKVLLHRNPLLKAELGGIVSALTTPERMRDFRAALANDGCDPIATVICMHHLAQPGDGFSAENLATLTDLALDKTWAMFMMPVGALMTMEMPELFDIRHVLHACTTRFVLDQGVADKEDRFMTIFSHLAGAIDNHDNHILQLHAWSKRKDGVAKRLVKIGPDLPLRVVVFTAEKNESWRLRAFEEDILYEWIKHALRSYDLTSEGAMGVIRDAISHGVGLLRAYAQNQERAVDAFLAAVARFLAHPRVPVNVSVAVLFDLGLREVAALLLEHAIKFGHRELVHEWIRSVGLNFGDSGPVLTPQRAGKLMRLAASVDVVAKRDPACETQGLVCAFLIENVPGALDPQTWSLGDGACIGDHFMGLIAQAELDRKASRVFKQGSILFRALRSARANDELLKTIGLVVGAPEYAYRAAIHVAARLAPWRPDFARFIFEKVFDHLGDLMASEERARDAADLFVELCLLSNERSAYYFVYSNVFEPFFTSHALLRGMSYVPHSMATLLCNSNSLTVINRALSKMPSGIGATVILRLTSKTIYENAFNLPVFIDWNSSFRFIRRPEYAYISAFDTSNHVQMDQVKQHFNTNDEDRAIWEFYRRVGTHSILTLEKLYVFARPYLQ